jgi:hypothetical protein
LVTIGYLGGFQPGVTNISSGGFYWTNSGTNSDSNADTAITRAAAANIRFGLGDAAAPVAQTLSVQNVLAGTTDIAGAAFTIAGSQGTGTGTGGSIVFKTAPAGTTGSTQNALATAMTILGNGNVGIGNTAPAYPLDVTGNMRVVTGTKAIQIATSGAGVDLITPNTSLYINNNMNQNLFINAGTSTGLVGIGTATPNQGRLEVKGGTVCVDTDSDDNATSCIASESDARLKTNVVDLTLNLDTLMKLRPVSYDWKYNDPEVLKHYPLIARFADRPHTIGLIAQEVQQVVPEAIEAEKVGDKEVQYFQLDYTKLVPVIIKAVQDLKHMFDGHDAAIEALKAENAEQKAAIEALRMEIDALKQQGAKQ